jgi:hypothetical protein
LRCWGISGASAGEEIETVSVGWLVFASKLWFGRVHFCSWELASVLKDAMAEFDSAGAKLIAIGVGTPEKARILADRVLWPRAEHSICEGLKLLKVWNLAENWISEWVRVAAAVSYGLLVRGPRA